MLKITIAFIIFSFTGSLLAQDLGAYSDYKKRFYIFDHGKTIKIEDLEAQKFAIGGECVLYINNQGNLNLYREGVVTKLEPTGVVDFFATDHIAAFSIHEKLKVIEKNQAVTLSTRCPLYQVQDSLIVFYDKNLVSLRVYYKGQVSDIESGMVGIPVSNIKSGDNIIAYISSQNNDFKIWYQGNVNTILTNVDRLTFAAGKDIVAYVNILDNTFHAYYAGTDFKMEDFPPKSFKMGDEFVAYVDNMGSFKIFYKGEPIELNSFTPNGYLAEDNLLVFNEDDYAKVFYQGKIYELEAYIPKAYKLDWNTVAYLDNSNRIFIFSKGEKKYLSNDLITSFDIFRDLIIMGAKVDRTIINYNGEVYNSNVY